MHEITFKGKIYYKKEITSSLNAEHKSEFKYL
jgi:hypothetical protein